MALIKLENNKNLIETFCIVNNIQKGLKIELQGNLIETFCIVNNIINFWKTSLNKKSNFKQNYEERKRFNKVVDFTLSNK